eukprot:gene11706-8054_t
MCNFFEGKGGRANKKTSSMIPVKQQEIEVADAAMSVSEGTAKREVQANESLLSVPHEGSSYSLFSFRFLYIFLLLPSSSLRMVSADCHSHERHPNSSLFGMALFCFSFSFILLEFDTVFPALIPPTGEGEDDIEDANSNGNAAYNPAPHQCAKEHGSHENESEAPAHGEEEKKGQDNQMAVAQCAELYGGHKDGQYDDHPQAVQAMMFKMWVVSPKGEQPDKNPMVQRSGNEERETSKNEGRKEDETNSTSIAPAESIPLTR